jgi:hypothetical protein
MSDDAPIEAPKKLLIEKPKRKQKNEMTGDELAALMRDRPKRIEEDPRKARYRVMATKTFRDRYLRLEREAKAKKKSGQ